MAPADPPSTVPGQRLGLPGAPGPLRRAGDDPALLDLAALEEEARGILPPAGRASLVWRRAHVTWP